MRADPLNSVKKEQTLNRICKSCNSGIIQATDNFCPVCGAPVGAKRSRAATAFLTLLACLGFFAVYEVITFVIELIYEFSFVTELPGFPNFTTEDFYSRLSYRYCEVGILTAVVVLLAFFLIFKIARRSFRDEVCLYTVAPAPSVGLVTLGATGQVAVSIGLTILYALFPALSQYSVGDTFDNILENSNPVTAVLFIGVITPLLEEMLFRGIIYTRLRKIMPVSASIALSAVIFGAAHGNVEQFCYATVMGLVCALAFQRYGSLWASFFIHFAFNSVSFLLEYVPDDPALIIALFFICTGLFVIFFAYLFLTKNLPTKAVNDNEAL